MTNYSFDSSKSVFFQSIKANVDSYFRRNEIHPAGNRKLYVKSGIQVLSALVLYITLVFFTPPVAVSVLLCILLGGNLAIIGFNVMHEGGHQAFSRHRRLNDVSAYFLNILGGISYYWKIKHNVNHHTYTNVEGLDSDIDVKPFMRLHKGQPWKPYHRFQHVYWIGLYGISYLAWIFYEDFAKYFSRRDSKKKITKTMPLREHIIFWLTKIFYMLLYVVVPIYVLGFLSWLIGFLIITVVCGLVTSIVFQLAHVVEGTAFHDSKAPATRKQEWAIHQVISTANFGTSSKTLHWLLGGLNFQIEHHLFPRISHIHYPAISQFVKQACREADVTYHEYTSMIDAFVSHIRHIRQLGAQAG